MHVMQEADSVGRRLGERIHNIMWRRGLTQLSLADALGLDQSTLSKKLRGKRRWYADEIAIVASTLGVSAGDLYGEVPPPTFSPPSATANLDTPQRPRVESNHRPTAYMSDTRRRHLADVLKAA